MKKRQWIFLAVTAVIIAGAIAFMTGSLTKDNAENSSTVQAGFEDGEYQVEVELLGGSGKAKIASPAKLIVENGEM